MAKASDMQPRSGTPLQNAKAQPKQRQFYGKGGPSSQKHPPKKAGLSGDSAKSRKGSPFAKKGK